MDYSKKKKKRKKEKKNKRVEIRIRDFIDLASRKLILEQLRKVTDDYSNS